MPCPKKVNVVDKILHEVLQRGDSTQNYIQGSRRMKIDNRVYLDNIVKNRKIPGNITLTEALQSHSKRSKKHKKYGSLDLLHFILFLGFLCIYFKLLFKCSRQMLRSSVKKIVMWCWG